MSKLALLRGDIGLRELAIGGASGGLQGRMLGDPGLITLAKLAISGLSSFFGSRGQRPGPPPLRGIGPFGGVISAVGRVGPGAGLGTLSALGRLLATNPRAAAILRAAGVAIPAIGVGVALPSAVHALERRFGRGRRPAAAGMDPRRRRHMHVTNPKALRRALRRVGGFAKLAKKVISFTSPRAARGRPHFKFKSKAKRF